MKVSFGSFTREGCDVRRDLTVLHAVLTKLCCYDHEGYDFCTALDNLSHELINESVDLKDVLGDFRDMLYIALKNDK